MKHTDQKMTKLSLNFRSQGPERPHPDGVVGAWSPPGRKQLANTCSALPSLITARFLSFPKILCASLCFHLWLCWKLRWQGRVCPFPGLGKRSSWSKEGSDPVSSAATPTPADGQPPVLSHLPACHWWIFSLITSTCFLSCDFPGFLVFLQPL